MRCLQPCPGGSTRRQRLRALVPRAALGRARGGRRAGVSRPVCAGSAGSPSRGGAGLLRDKTRLPGTPSLPVATVVRVLLMIRPRTARRSDPLGRPDDGRRGGDLAQLGAEDLGRATGCSRTACARLQALEGSDVRGSRLGQAALQMPLCPSAQRRRRRITFSISMIAKPAIPTAITSSPSGIVSGRVSNSSCMNGA